MPTQIGCQTIPLDPADLLREPSALLVWDMQRFVEGTPREALVTKSISTLVAAARQHRVLTVWSRHIGLLHAAEDRFWIRDMWRCAGCPDPAEFTVSSSPGSPEWEFHDAVRPLNGDLVLPKHRGMYFLGTPLRQILAARHIDVIVLTGIAMDEGIQRTALEAQQRGLFHVVVEDAVGAFTDVAHELPGSGRPA